MLADVEPLEPVPSGADVNERRCIVTGESGPRAALIRFVVGPEEILVPDIRGRLPGRGLWVSADRARLHEAMRTRAFARAARRTVVVPDTLVGDVERLLLRHTLDLLGLVARTGEVWPGWVKAEAQILRGRGVVLLEARDAAAHGRKKARQLARNADVPLMRILDAAEMGLALGRENVVHAALGAGRLAQRFLEEARRLEGFRSAEADEAPSALSALEEPSVNEERAQHAREDEETA